MAKRTIWFAVLLILLGIAAYVGTGAASVTALIPSMFGVALLAAGAVALIPRWRRHAIWGAALFALLGLLGSAGGLARLFALLMGGEVARPEAAITQAIMAVICAAFLALCIRFFIGARRGQSA